MTICVTRLPRQSDYARLPIAELTVADLESELTVLSQLLANASTANDAPRLQWEARRDSLLDTEAGADLAGLELDALADARFGPRPTSDYPAVSERLLESLMLRQALCQESLTNLRWKRALHPRH